jgi:hypothetical protein
MATDVEPRRAPKADAITKEALIHSEEAKLLAGRTAEREMVVPLVYRILYVFFDRKACARGDSTAHLT